MSEQERLECTSPWNLIDDLPHHEVYTHIRGPSERKLELLANALSRFVLAGPRTISENSKTVDVYSQETSLSKLPECILWWLVGRRHSGWGASIKLGCFFRDHGLEMARLKHGQEVSQFVRDIFGNPFHAVGIDVAWLTWHDGTVPKIAQAIYDSRAFGYLPILADALEEAGCEDAGILNHCREPGLHVEGCWVVDLVPGKE